MGVYIQEHISLKEFTTLKIGGTARYFCRVEKTEELKEAFSFAKEKEVSVAIIGGGSNLLIAGGEINALVIKIDIKGIEWKEGEDILKYRDVDILKSHNLTISQSPDSVFAIAGAGESWDKLVEEACSRGLWGIENLSGIPGTVGAAPIQNIGAYGTEIREVLEWVEVFDTKTGTVRKLTKEECQFGYRDSIFKHTEGKSLIVTRVAFRLKKSGVPNLEYKDLRESFKLEVPGSKEEREQRLKQITLQDIRRTVLQIRSKKFPDLKEFGTAGSFFKNPIISQQQFDALKAKYPDLPGFPLPTTNNLPPTTKIPLAWILDKVCGLKGYRKGNVALFERQPIVLVQNGRASSEEIEAFAKEIITQVKEKTGIVVEWEVQHIR